MKQGKTLFRKWSLGFALLAVMLSSRVYALGLGEIELHSALNQPFDAQVPVLSAGSDELLDLRVQLASPELFARSGLDRPALLSKLRFAVVDKAIHITSTVPVREPYLDFLLEVSWSGGQLLREYTVLVDPPVLMPAARPAVQAPVSRAAPADVAPADVAPAPAAAPVAAPVASGFQAGAEYGPTSRNDTLWDIAMVLRPNASVGPRRMMLALLRKNPDAFYDNNVNNLKAGYVLRIPSLEEITSITPDQATAEFNRQNAQWRAARAGGSQAAAAPTVSEPAPTSTADVATDGAARGAGESPAPVLAEGRLQLVAPEDEDGGKVTEGDAAAPGGALDKDATLEQLSRELALALESGEAQRNQTRELQIRLEELEKQMEAMHRLIALKDDELARLQGRVADPATVQEGESAENFAPAPQNGDRAVAARESTGLFSNPFTLALLALVILLSLVLIWVLVRQRKGAEEDLAGVSTGAVTPRVEPETEPVRSAPQTQSAAVDRAVERAMPGPSVAASRANDADSETDPLAEADVYLAYGRYVQAADLVKGALEARPDDADLHIKLLDIYAAARDSEAFNREAEVLLGLLDGQDDPRWERVRTLGQSLSPGNALYGGDSVAEADSPPATQAATAAATAAAPTVDPLLESTSEELGAERRSSAGSLEENMLEFDLGGGHEDDGGDGLLSSVDEAGTKLDLARAYMDMGDPDGARSILQEVLDEGSQEQQQEARGLLDTLG